MEVATTTASLTSYFPAVALVDVVFVFFLVPPFAVVAAFVPILTQYGTGLKGGRRFTRVLLSRMGGRDSTSATSQVRTELTIYVLLSVLYALPLLAIVKTDFLQGSNFLQGSATGIETVLVWYTVGFMAATWVGGVVVLSWLDPDARTDLPVLVSLAVELGVFGLGMWVVVGLVSWQWTRPDFFYEVSVFLLVACGLGLLSRAAHDIVLAPEPGERAYAVGVVTLGAVVAVTSLLVGAVGRGPLDYLGHLGLLLGGAILALGALAALASVE